MTIEVAGIGIQSPELLASWGSNLKNGIKHYRDQRKMGHELNAMGLSLWIQSIKVRKVLRAHTLHIQPPALHNLFMPKQPWPSSQRFVPQCGGAPQHRDRP